MMKIDNFQDYFDHIIQSEMNEGLSKQAFNRMEGLTNIKQMQTLLDTASVIADDLLDEGFDPDEVAEYLAKKVADKVMPGFMK